MVRKKAQVKATITQTKLSLLPCGIRGVQYKAVFKTLSDITIKQLQGISGPDREGLASYQVD